MSWVLTANRRVHRRRVVHKFRSKARGACCKVCVRGSRSNSSSSPVPCLCTSRAIQASSSPLAHQIQRIYEGQLAGHLYSGSTSHGQAFIHLKDVIDAIERAVERRTQLPSEVAILIGEPETLSYDELQHTFQRLICDESWETQNVPGFIAKAGAWVQDHIPGQDPFIKPWMIDRARAAKISHPVSTNGPCSILS